MIYCKGLSSQSLFHDRKIEISDMADQVTAAHFQPHLDKIFRVQGGRHELILTTVHTWPLSQAYAEAGMRQPFTLVFKGPPDDILEEGLHILQAEGGPAFELYMIPIHTPERGRQDYQAAFN
jgi:hypothetical protein